MNIYDLSDAELLDCLGPDWSKMTQEERDAYGPPLQLVRATKVTRKPRRTLPAPSQNLTPPEAA